MNKKHTFRNTNMENKKKKTRVRYVYVKIFTLLLI